MFNKSSKKNRDLLLTFCCPPMRPRNFLLPPETFSDFFKNLEKLSPDLKKYPPRKVSKVAKKWGSWKVAKSC